jgi:hypothetical protein
VIKIVDLSRQSATKSAAIIDALAALELTDESPRTHG